LPLNNHQSRIEGQWLLFDSFAREQRVSSARKLETAADFSTEQARQDLILQVVRVYYGVVVAQENLAAAREALRTAEATELRVAAMEKAGLVVASDLLSAQVFRAQMKEREIRAANQLELARASLARELGFAPEALLEPAESLAAPAATEAFFEEWEQRALRSRPALRAAELQQQAAGSNAKASRSDFGPRVGAFAAFERDAERLASGPSGTNWTAGVRVELNLFAGGADRARLAEAQARERQAGQQLEWFRSGVRLEVRQAFLETQAAQARVEAARGTVEQAKESLRIIENRYGAGLATMTDVLRAQSAAFDARAILAAALHDAQVARAALLRAAGTLSTEELRK
jgi:outer membrane protein TolC